MVTITQGETPDEDIFSVEKLTYLSLNVSVTLTAQIEQEESWIPDFRLTFGNETEGTLPEHAGKEEYYVFKDG